MIICITGTATRVFLFQFSPLLLHDQLTLGWAGTLSVPAILSIPISKSISNEESKIILYSRWKTIFSAFDHPPWDIAQIRVVFLSFYLLFFRFVKSILLHRFSILANACHHHLHALLDIGGPMFPLSRTALRQYLGCPRQRWDNVLPGQRRKCSAKLHRYANLQYFAK